MQKKKYKQQIKQVISTSLSLKYNNENETKDNSFD